MKKYLVAIPSALLGLAALADGEGSFDPSSLMSDAASTVSGIATAVGTVLVAAAGIYLAFVGYRAFKAAVNRV